ncbi:MAG: hypothetical protein C0438_10745 [Pseudomonas sp.]|nr:hypothetical protein [Pseudomonas sp.]
MKLKLAFSPGFLRQAICRSVKNCTIPVGASLLAKRVFQPTSSPTDTPASRAGSLPQDSLRRN